MEKRKLQSMVDYVLELGETSTIDMDQGDWYCKELEKIQSIRNYANFLSMPLTEELIDECFDNISLMKKSYYLLAYSKFEDLIKVTNSLSPIYLTQNAVTKYQI